MSETFRSFSDSLRKAPKKIKWVVVSNMSKETTLVMSDLQERSPVDSGKFSSSWRRTPVPNGVNTIFHERIENPVDYGEYLDFGVPEGEHPWFFPDPERKPTGKLTLANGMVWAGGKSPSGFVIGGIINPVIFENSGRVTELANKIAEDILDEI